MTDLNSEAAKLVQAGRSALRPGAGDRERVFQALLPKLGGGLAAAGTSGTAQAFGAARATMLKVSAAIVGLGLAGGGLYLAQRPEPPPAGLQVQAPAAPRPDTAPPALHEPAAEPEPAVAQPAAEPELKRSPSPPRAGDKLAEEVAILSRASSELRAGRAAAALKLLDEHQRAFPQGLLAQERTAARVQALCALGRKTEASAALERLARSAPHSPHVTRARKACGFGAESGD